jgi:peptidoglycan/LPS O-acetylase OafA/YrhL
MLDPTQSVRLLPTAAGSSQRPGAKGSRLSELDALRGLAALSVFLGHAFGLMPQTPGLLLSIQNTPLRFFYDGNAAVLLFFVLSGFVLNLRYVETGSYPVGWAGGFIIRRVFRIYPAFLASMGLALLLRTCFFRPEWTHGFSAWFSAFWQEPLPWGQFARCMTLIGPSIRTAFINPPVWSLVFEMRISLFFPLVILLVNPKRRGVWDAVLLIAMYVLSMPLAPSAASFQFFPQFVLGAVCAKYFSRIQPWLTSLSGAWKAVWMLVALVLYGTAVTVEPLNIQDRRLKFLLPQIVSFGAAGLILGSASLGRISLLLKSKPLQFLGHTSYSFYLTHFLFLMTVAPLVYRASGSFIIAWLATLAVAYLVSELFFRFVEVPGMRLGSRAADCFVKRWAKARA